MRLSLGPRAAGRNPASSRTLQLLCGIECAAVERPPGMQRSGAQPQEALVLHRGKGCGAGALRQRSSCIAGALTEFRFAT